MSYRPENPLIVQSDQSILLETNHPDFLYLRDQLLTFAELIKSPEYIYTYRITPLSLWNAAAAGVKSEQIIDLLTRYSKFELPASLVNQVEESISRYGKLKLQQKAEQLLLIGERAGDY